jgi:hypothetical protein
MKVTNSLISGYLERISSKVFDGYHEQITALIGNQRGVYALYKKTHLYYVGLATNLRTRVKHHLKDRHAKKWDSFSLYLIRSVEHLHELESLLIRISEPRGNVMLGKFRRSQNLIQALKKSMEERNRLQLKEILGGRKKRKEPSKKRKLKRPGMRGTPPLKELLSAGAELKAVYKGREYPAQVDAEGMIHIDQKVYNSPSLAATHITHRPMNGWTFWKHKNEQGQWVKIDELRHKK